MRNPRNKICIPRTLLRDQLLIQGKYTVAVVGPQRHRAGGTDPGGGQNRKSSHTLAIINYNEAESAVDGSSGFLLAV